MKMELNPRNNRSILHYASLALGIQLGTLACDPVPPPPEVPESADATTETEGENPVDAEGEAGETAIILDTSDRIQKETYKDSDILWTIDGQPIYAQTYAFMMERQREQIESLAQPGELADALAQVEKGSQETLIAMHLLAREATKTGLDKDPQVMDALSASLEEVILQYFIEDQLEAQLAAADVEDWYNRHLVQYRFSTVDLRRLTVADEETAKAIKAEIDGGKDFEELAKARSTDEFAASGGDFQGADGPLDLDTVNPALKATLSSMTDGGTSDPMEDPSGGWYLLHLKKKTDGVKPIEEVRPEIEAKIQEEAIYAIINHLQTEAVIVSGEEPAPEGAAPVAEGETVAVWVNGKPYTQTFFLNIIGPQLQQQEYRFNQQLQMQMQMIPEAERETFVQQQQARFQQQMMQAQQQMMESIVNQALLASEATSRGYAEDQRVKRDQAIRSDEVLASFYFNNFAQTMSETDQAANPDFMTRMVDELWLKAVILDAEGTPIPPPDRSNLNTAP